MTTSNQLAQLGSPGVSTGFKNKLINGNFDFWQRGTTNTLTVAGYTVADRWQYINDGTLSTGTVFSQQTFTPGQTDVPNNPKYFFQAQYTSVNTPSNYIRQRIENVYTCAGQTVTISAWVRVTSGTAACSFQFQQEFGTGGSPGSPVYSIGQTNFTATTTWTQFTATIAIPSISGKGIGTDNNDALNACIFFPAGGASGTIQVAQVQVEVGSTATNFDIRPVGIELQLCQRYYQTFGLCGGVATSSQIHAMITFPVEMRATPSAYGVVTGGTCVQLNRSPGTITSLSGAFNSTKNGAGIYVNSSDTGMNVGQVAWAHSNSVFATAEL